MPRLLQTPGDLIDGIKINQNSRVTRDGRVFWVKRRRGWSVPIIRCANVFFHLADNPIVVWPEHALWQNWEIHCYTLLHGPDGYRAFVESDAVWTEHFPGEDLAVAADRNALSQEMLAAAGCELRRAHHLPCSSFNGTWSHGDPHFGNFLFDHETGRARLIDFEVAHKSTLSEEERHAEDLLVFLQDMMGRTDPANWLPAATCFLHSYNQNGAGPNGAVSALLQRLKRPSGVSRLWWGIRTNFIPVSEMAHRIDTLLATMAAHNGRAQDLRF